MKTILIAILSLVTISLFSQAQLPPRYYLNSVEIDMDNTHINPSGIEEMRVEKNTERGEIYMITKRSLRFETLDMILKKHSDIDDSVNHVVYFINGKIVTDKAKVKVDDSFFIQIEFKPLDQVNYIDDKYRGLILAEIRLLNEKPKPATRIRGEEMVQTKK
jgi:hypothetical protein